MKGKGKVDMSRKGMTAQERIEDISKRSGMSVDICRRVLNAETESVIASLRKGEKATLSGRVTLRPEMRQKVGIGLQVENVVKVKAEISSVIDSGLKGLNEFEKSEISNIDENEENILKKSRQIPYLY